MTDLVKTLTFTFILVGCVDSRDLARENTNFLMQECVLSCPHGVLKFESSGYSGTKCECKP